MPKGIHYIPLICITIAALTLSSAFAAVGFVLGIAVTLLVSIAWGIFVWRVWLMGSVLCMLIFVLGISLGAILEASRLILLFSLLATLSAWDMAAFQKRLLKSPKLENEDELTRIHLLRLVSVLIIGMILPLLAFGLQFDLKFWQVFLLGILLLVGLSQVFSQFKHSSSE